MKLSSLLTADRILLDIKEKNKDALLSYVIKKLAEIENVADPDTLEKEVKEREALGNTGIGRGIGFPHAKSSQVSKITVLLACPSKPIDYGSLDGVPVSIILFIVAPADGDNNVYLHTMARISRLLGKNEVREEILSAKTPEEVIDIINANEV